MLKRILFALVVCGLASVVAHADTFTLTGSLGEKYALDETLVSGTTYDIYLTIDASSLTTPSGKNATTTLGDVAIKVGNSISGLVFISAPTGYTVEEGGLDNGGCKSNTTNGFFCFTGNAPVGSTGDVYTFEAQVTLDSTINPGSDMGSIKDQFFDSLGNKNEQLSQDTVIDPHTAVTPEPSSLALLGSGVLGLAGVVRRRFKR